DARSGEAELEGDHLGHARLVPRSAGDARRVHGPDQVEPGASDLSGPGALQGQVAIVTGAGRGIGHAVATALAREGAPGVLAPRTRQQLAATAAAIRESGGTALAIPTDVTQDTAVEAMVEQAIAELGRVDALVTDAGAASFGPVVSSKPADWDAILPVNPRAVMVCGHAALPVLLR